MKHRNLLLFTLSLLIGVSAIAQQPLRVLFLGNSYTTANDLPNTFSSLCTSLGKPVQVASNAPGGYTFNGHSTNANSLALIQQGDWDVVVLQEQSQLPSFPPGQVASQCYPFAARLDSIINAINPCTETMFYMTWGRQNGDASNCANYPVVCTYEGMQGRLRESYLEMAQDNQASVSPVGMAWKKVRDSYPEINLYSGDGSHPDVAGTYLTACVFFSSLFHQSAFDASYTAGLPDSTAEALQTAAYETVMDSLSQWQGSGSWLSGTISEAQQGSAGNVSFQTESLHATDVSWDFGDGSTGSGNGENHTYAAPGSYTVVVTFSNACRQVKDSIQLDLQWTTAIGEASETAQAGFLRSLSGQLVAYPNGASLLRVLTTDGRLFYEMKSVTAETIIDTQHWPAGIYLWEMIPADKEKSSGRGKIFTGK